MATRRSRDLRRWIQPNAADDAAKELEEWGKTGACILNLKSNWHEVSVKPPSIPCPKSKDGRHVVVMNEKVTGSFPYFWVCTNCRRGFHDYPHDPPE